MKKLALLLVLLSLGLFTVGCGGGPAAPAPDTNEPDPVEPADMDNPEAPAETPAEPADG